MQKSLYILVIAGCLLVLTALGIVFLVTQCQHGTPSDKEESSLDDPKAAAARSVGAEQTSTGGATIEGSDGGKPGRDKGSSASQGDAKPSSGFPGGFPGDGTSGQGGSRPDESSGTRGADNGGTSAGGVFSGPVAPSRDLPVEAHATGAIYYEGRWIEGAIAQRRHELLLRRAYAEAADYAKRTYGTVAALAPFEDRRTAVVLLEDANTFLVSSVMHAGGVDRAVAWEVVRGHSGEWHVVPAK